MNEGSNSQQIVGPGCTQCTTAGFRTDHALGQLGPALFGVTSSDARGSKAPEAIRRISRVANPFEEYECALRQVLGGSWVGSSTKQAGSEYARAWVRMPTVFDGDQGIARAASNHARRTDGAGQAGNIQNLSMLTTMRSSFCITLIQGPHHGSADVGHDPACRQLDAERQAMEHLTNLVEGLAFCSGSA